MMGQLIFGLILLIIGLAIVAIVDSVQNNLQYQIDNLKKENKQLKQRLFELVIRKQS